MPTEKSYTSSEESSLQIGDLVKNGKIPLKIVSGTQSTESIRLAPGAVVAHEGATVIFVCG